MAWRERYPSPSHAVTAPPSPPVIAIGINGIAVTDNEGNCVMCVGGDFDYIGLLVDIASTSELMANALTWSGLWEGRVRGFRGDPRRRWMMLRNLMLGTSKAPVLNDLPLWELAEVLLGRRRVEFGVNDDDYLRG